MTPKMRTAIKAAMAAPAIDLPVLIRKVDSLLHEIDEATGPFVAREASEWHARRRAELERVAKILTETHGAKLNSRWDGAAVKLAGIRSTSTSGLESALRNWREAARRKLEKEATHADA